MSDARMTMQGSGTGSLRDLLQERERRIRAIQARQQRCRALGKPSDAEIARMVAEFQARGGQVRSCPPAHLLPVHNGVGREARRWTA